MGRHLFRIRDFRRYVVGRVVSDLGDLVVPVAVAFAVITELDGSAQQLGVVLAAESLPLIAFVLFGGAIADRLAPRTVMIAADIIRAAVQLILAVSILAGTLTLWQLVLAMVLQGAAQAAFQPAATRLLPSIVEPGQLQSANATLSISRNAARMGGPAVAALLIAIWGVGTAFILDGITFVVSFVTLALLPRHLNPEASRENSMRREIREGFREFRQHRWLWTTVLYFGAYQALALAPFLVVGPVLAQEHFGGAGAWAAILVANGIGAITGGLLMMRYSPARPLRLACLVTFFEAIALVTLGLVAPLPLVVGTWLVAGVAASIWGVLWDTALQEHVPSQALGRVSAYDWFVSSAAAPLSLALVGLVASGVGDGPTVVGGGIALAVATLLLFLVPEVRRLGRAAPVT